MSFDTTEKRGFFGRKKKTKIDLRETKAEKEHRKMTSKVSDPTKAIREQEPFAAAQNAVTISQVKHKDQFGNEIGMLFSVERIGWITDVMALL